MRTSQGKRKSGIWDPTNENTGSMGRHLHPLQHDRRIYVKKFTNQRPKVIKDTDHLMSIALASTYNYVTTKTRPMDRNRQSGSTMGTGHDDGIGAVNERPDANEGAMVADATPNVAPPGKTQKTSTPNDAHEDERDESPGLNATMGSGSLLPDNPCHHYSVVLIWTIAMIHSRTQVRVTILKPIRYVFKTDDLCFILGYTSAGAWWLGRRPGRSVASSFCCGKWFPVCSQSGWSLLVLLSEPMLIFCWLHS